MIEMKNIESGNMNKINKIAKVKMKISLTRILIKNQFDLQMMEIKNSESGNINKFNLYMMKMKNSESRNINKGLA